MDKTPWSVPVAVDDIPESGLHMEIDAAEAARAEIAKLANVREVRRLSAEFDMTRRGAGARVSGRVRAVVGQTCVVSLEPIENGIDETIDVTFAPPGAARPKDEGEPPEPLVGGRFDLGALATEFLLLAIDPYPRKPGVEFVSPKSEERGERPFAALESLKNRLGGGKS